MDQRWKSELKSQCFWSLYQSYQQLLIQSQENVVFFDSVYHWSRILSCISKSRFCVPFCFALGNFDCANAPRRENHPDFSTSDTKLIHFVDIINKFKTSSTQCYFSFGHGENMLSFGGILQLQQLDNLGHSDPVSFVKHKLSPIELKLFQIKNMFKSSQSDHTDHKQFTITPTLNQFSTIVQRTFRGINSSQVLFGFYMIRDKIVDVKEMIHPNSTIFFGNGIHYSEISLSSLRKLAPNSIILEHIQKYQQNKITVKFLSKRQIKSIAKIFNGDTNICVHFDKYCYDYETLLFLKELGLKYFPDGSEIDDFFSTFSDFFKQTKHQITKNYFLRDQYQATCVFQSIPQSFEKSNRLFVISLWCDQDYCDNKFKCEILSKENQSFAREAHATLLKMMPTRGKIGVSSGCIIIHDEMVLSFDCCGRMFVQNLIDSNGKTQSTYNIHPDDLRNLIKNQTQSIISYHNQRTHFYNQCNKNNLLSLLFVDQLIQKHEKDKKMKNCYQLVKISSNLFAKVFFGIQNN